MNKHRRHSFNLYNLLGLLVAAFCIYFLLVCDSIFPFSISSVMGNINRFVNHWPVLIVGLLPIYIAFMIFGIATLGFYLGSLLERVVGHFIEHQKNKL